MISKLLWTSVTKLYKDYKLKKYGWKKSIAGVMFDASDRKKKIIYFTQTPSTQVLPLLQSESVKHLGSSPHSLPIVIQTVSVCSLLNYQKPY